MSGETKLHENRTIAFKDSPVPFNRLAPGAVLSDPRGGRYMKMMLEDRTYWVPSVPTDKGVYTDKEMRDRAKDDWEAWL